MDTPAILIKDKIHKCIFSIEKDTKVYIIAFMEREALRSAIECVGSQAELAKRIGTTQPTISRWKRVPAEYVIPVENATSGKILRSFLRPDIYPIEVKK